MEKLIKSLLEKYKELSEDDESVIIFVYKKEIGWEFLKYAYLEGHTIINQTLPFKVEYNQDIETYDFGFHNSDIPYEEKEEIERAFREGKLKCLIATQTLAYGVNLPADRVIILVTSFYDRQKGKVRTIPSIMDVIQMEGRAGRFGIKDIGYVNILRYRTSEKTYNKVYDETFGNSNTELYENLMNFRGLDSDYLGESAVLSSFILSAYKFGEGDIMDFLNRTYSFRNLNDKKRIYKVLDFLIQKGYIDNNRVSEKGEFCLSTGIPPTAYEEFLRRANIDGSLFIKVRPLIYTKRIKDCLKPFLSESDYHKFYDKEIIKLLRPFDFPEDGSHELIFYIMGKLFEIQNIHNPPYELYLNTEVLHLSKVLLKISDYFFISDEDIFRVAHSLRYGLDYEFSPMGGIEGIGHIRANAIKISILISGKKFELGFKNKVSDILDIIDKGALRDVISTRYTHRENVDKEFKNIVNILEKQSNKLLIDEKILRSIALFSRDIRKEDALRLPIDELILRFSL